MNKEKAVSIGFSAAVATTTSGVVGATTTSMVALAMTGLMVVKATTSSTADGVTITLSLVMERTGSRPDR